MTSRYFVWLATDGGVWALPGNWNDITDGQDPSLIAPGAQDSVSVMGETGAGIGTITGPGGALLASFGGNNALSGQFGFTTLVLGQGGLGGLLEIGADSTTTAATGTIASGSLISTSAGADCAFTGTLTLGTGQNGLGAPVSNLDATNGGIVTAAALLLDAGSAAIYVDPDSLIEIGGTGDSIAGALTIDAAGTLSGEGDANSFGAMINNGTVIAQGGNLRIGTVTGQGTLAIAAGATLTMNGIASTGQVVAFQGANGTLALSTEFDLPEGALSGFTTGDAIDVLGSPISSANYQGTGADTGILTLYYGSQIAATLSLLGTYTNEIFLTAGDGALGTLISVTPDYGNGGTLSSGTANPDQYLWVATTGGVWDQAANWRDVTTGAQPPAIAPGHNNLVTINGAPDQFEVIAGPADAASMNITGEVALSGSFAIGTFAIGLGPAQVIGTVDLLGGTTLTANAASIADGALSLAGTATLFAVTGTLTLGGGSPGIGLPITYLSVNAGAQLTAQSFVMGGGSGDFVTTDSTGSIEIGGISGAAAGTVTIDATGTLSGNGQVNPFGSIVDNGMISAQGGVLVLGSVTGTGALSIGTDAGLLLESPTALPITFTGSDAVLAFEDELVLPTGVITGFQPGETIDIENDQITSLHFTMGANVSTLTLQYESQIVGTLLLAGNYTKENFIFGPDGALGTDIEVVANGGGGGGGGQGNTDLLAWTTPGSGAWSKAANWTDVTLGEQAQSPPGSLNAVQITGFTNGEFQAITGPAACASIVLYGNTELSGAFNFGTLSIGNAITPGGLALASGSTVAVTGQAAIANGTLSAVSPGTTVNIAGTLSLGGGAQGDGTAATDLSAINHAAIQCAGLNLGGGLSDVVIVDALSSIEIGTIGTPTAGALTVDPGFAITGNGTLNQDGQVVDDGGITAIGGTLAVGNVSGTGSLAIGVEAVLQLTGTESCPILFTGGGATLLLAGVFETPSGTIIGFAPGDAIVTGTSPLTQVTYTPGIGNIGTLTMYFDNQAEGSLLLAGNYAGDQFAVLPDGQGAAISVQPSNGGASGGTTTPDDYVWTGAVGSNWNDAGNWDDISAGQDPADIAPGLNDIDTVQGPTGNNFLDLVGPANAATLTLLGNVAPTLQYSVGLLNVGGLLALGATAEMAAADAAVTGSIVGEGGALTITQTLTLGGAGGSGILTAANGSQLTADTLVMDGTGDAVAIIGAASIEIGAAHEAVAGDLTVDDDALITGAGALDVTGDIVDDGTITANGTLSVGAVTGIGTLQIGVGATLGLDAPCAGVVIDFAGPGNLIIAPGAMPSSAIVDFTEGDTILVPFSGITSEAYAQTGPGIGTLTLFEGTQTVASLILLGIGTDQGFAATPYAGETQITTQPSTTQGGGGGGNMGQGNFNDGADTAFLQSEPAYVQPWLQKAMSQDGYYLTAWIDTSASGSSWDPWQPGYANIAIVTDPTAGTQVGLPPGYVAIVAQGGEPLTLTDRALGNGLLVGNAGQDTIVGLGANDTLIGGDGPGSLFWTNLNGTIVGNGNDTIITGIGNASITTSQGRSLLFLGAADNLLTSYGSDSIIGGPGSIANDTVHTSGNAIIFAPPLGQMTLYANTGADTVVCSQNGGTLRMYGSASNGAELWGGGTNSYTEYFGGQGTAIVVGDAGAMYVQGGAGAMTVFGGTGQAQIFGTPGPSAFVVGNGPSTVSAASGNSVWLAGAGNESLVASGGDVLFWGARSTGNNVFQAGNGPITMHGGSGNDLLIAGTGAATMTGGVGADVFSFTNGLTGGPNALDTITDFQIGTDLISLNGYAGGIQAVLNTQTISGDTTSYTLPDGTHLTLQGITGLTAASFTGT